jgi:hypothetical protein
VLVAEDDDLVRGLASHVLRRNGYEVLEAASGEEALVLADRHAGPDPAAGQRRGHAAHERTGAGRPPAGQRPELRVLLMSGHPPTPCWNTAWTTRTNGAAGETVRRSDAARARAGCSSTGRNDISWARAKRGNPTDL